MGWSSFVFLAGVTFLDKLIDVIQAPLFKRIPGLTLASVATIPPCPANGESWHIEKTFSLKYERSIYSRLKSSNFNNRSPLYVERSLML